MRRSIGQRLLRLSVQVAIFLALMVGVLLRLRSGTMPLWEVMIRPLAIFACGMVFLGGRRWASWPYALLCAWYGWWYLQAAQAAAPHIEVQIGTAVAALLELVCAGIVLAIPPVPDAPREGPRGG